MFAEAIAGWEQWGLGLNEPPRLVRELTGGTLNHSWLVEAGSQPMVLRDGRAQAPGVDRYREYAMWTLAANAGIAPALIYADASCGLLVSEYIPGKHWHRGGAEPIDRKERLLMLLQRMHRLRSNWPAFDYRAHLEKLRAAVEVAGIEISAVMAESHEQARQAAERLQQDSGRGLCHQDLVPANVLESVDGRLWLLDWEYAANGAVAWDHAAIAVEWGWAMKGAGIPEKVEEEACLLYRHSCELWRMGFTKRRP